MRTMSVAMLRRFGVAVTMAGLLAVSAPLAQAWMGVVTDDPGKIMDSDRVLKEVPRGTRLWVFKENGNWYEVKVPGSEEHGWISNKAFSNIFDGSQETTDIINEVDKLIAEGTSFFNEKKYAEALEVRIRLLEKLKLHYGTDHPLTGEIYSDIATTYQKQAKYPQAKEHFELALANLREAYGNVNSTTAFVLQDYGRYLQLVRQYAAAKKTLREALSNFRSLEGNQDLSIASVIHDLGNVASNEKDELTALKFYEEAMDIYKKDLDQYHDNLQITLTNAGDSHSRLKNFARSEDCYKEALALAKKYHGEQHDRTVDAINSLASLACEQLDHKQGRKYYEEALALNRKIHGDVPDVTTAECLTNLGWIQNYLGELTEAQKHYEGALALYRKLQGNEHTSTATALVSLGSLYQDQNDYAAAKRCYDEALAIRRKVLGNKHADTGLVLNCLGNLAHDQSDFPSARKYFDEALALFRQKDLAHEYANTADTLCNLGRLASRSGDYQAARRFLDEALGIYRKELSGDQASIASLLHELGDLTRDQGDSTAAKKYFEEALAIQRKVLGNEAVATARTLNCLGGMLRDEEEFDTARKHLEESLAIYRKLYGEGNVNLSYPLEHLGKLARVQGDYRSAWKYSEEALRINRRIYGKDHPNTVNYLQSLAALAVIEGDDDVAQRNFDDMRRIQRRYARYLLPTLAATEQLQYLENLYRVGWHISLSYGIQKSDNSTVASLSTAWLINGKSIGDEALAARELLARDTSNPQLAPLVLELQEVRQLLGSQSLAAVKPELTDAHQAKLTELAAREFKLARQLSDATGEAFVEVDWIETGKFRRTLPAKSLYVDVVRMSISSFDPKDDTEPVEHYVAWVVPPQGEGKIVILNLGACEAIDNAIVQARTSLANANDKEGLLRKQGEAEASAAVQKNLQAVADLVLKPLLPQLADKQELILSPDGALWLLPWAALPVAENKCLLEQCSIRYVNSGRDLVNQTGSAKLAVTAPAIVVNPNYNLTGAAAKAALRIVLSNFKIDERLTPGDTSRSSLPPVDALPFTSLEGTAAKPSLEQLAKSAPVFYEQEKALEAVVKKFQRPKYLLLSTHGFFLPDQSRQETSEKQQLLATSDTRSLPALTKDGKPVENPLLRCGLLFAGCNSPREAGLDDGILTGMEIVGMDLRGTELVVLSACETGIGKVRNGEGVAGLRQAFQLAGAQSVVSTLWQVPDRDSALIMQDFFTNLAAGQSKADALRNAQLKRIAARKEKSGAAHPFYWAAWTVTGE